MYVIYLNIKMSPFLRIFCQGKQCKQNIIERINLEKLNLKDQFKIRVKLKEPQTYIKNYLLKGRNSRFHNILKIIMHCHL
jgi:hypothetical protein